MKRPKILFYCGEPFLSEMIVETLRDFEWEVVAGFFGEEDIDISKERIANEDYDVFITSNTGMGAYTALKQICLLPEKRRFKAIYISGYVDQKIVDTCKEKDVVLVPMPFELEEFKSLIRRSVQERR